MIRTIRQRTNAAHYEARLLRWWHSGDVGMAEFVMVTLCIIGAIQLHRLTDAQIQQFGTYRQMNSIAPITMWEIGAIFLAVVIVAGTLLRMPIIPAIGFFLAAVFWGSIALIIWQVTGTFLTSVLYFAVALGSAKRTGELVGRIEGGHLWKRS